MWYVYMLRCSDGSLYSGVTTNIDRRFLEHKEGKVGAKYTRAKIALHMAYVEHSPSRSAAQRREFELKKLSKAEKEALAKEFLKEKKTLTKKRRTPK